MPVKFLSDEWASELERRLNENESFRRGIATTNATIQQAITTPDGERRYWLKTENGEVRIAPGDAPNADATISQDYDTAVALARSELNAVTAFMTGKVRISGNLGILMGLQGALAELPRVMQEMDVDY